MQDFEALGKHLMRIDQDVVFLRTRGEVNRAEILALYDLLLAVHQKYGWAFEIVDASEGGSMNAEVRRENADWHRRHNLHIDAIIFGAGLIVRTTYTLVLHAIRLISKSPARVYFVATEADAWALAEELRQKKHTPSTG